MGDNTDIVERLRSMYYELSRRQASTPFGERSELSGIPELLYEAAIKIQDLQGNEIERLRNERDKARRMYCDHVILHGTAHLINGNKGLDEITDAQSLARHLGWDYCNE